MTDEPGGAGPPAREYTHFAEPHAAAATSDSEWSEPTLIRHAEEPPEDLPPAADEVAPLPAPTEEAVAPPPVAGPEPAPQPDPAAAESPDQSTQHVRALEPVRDQTRHYYVPPVTARRARVNYQQGTVPDGHQALVEHAADVAVAAMPIPLRVLDVGCGAGALLAEMILRVPYAEAYVGVDPLPDLVPDELRDSDPRLGVIRAAAEALPFPDASFDLVIAMWSLEYWQDQRAGLAELSRVVGQHGKIVLVEPTSGEGRVHGPKDIARMLETAGVRLERTETVGRSRFGLASARAYVAAP